MIVFSPPRVDDDACGPRRTRDGPYVLGFYAEILERGQKLVAENVITGDPKQDGRIAKPGHRDRLIGAFAARMHLKAASDNCLAGSRNPLSPGDEIHVDTANNDDRLHAVILVSLGKVARLRWRRDQRESKRTLR